MEENKEKPEISEEVRQWFKKHNDERVERQKKIITELMNSKINIETDLNSLKRANKYLRERLSSWPFNTYVNWDRLCNIALKMGFAIIVLIIIIDALNK